MLSIRLARVGKRGQPTFRFVLMDRRRDPWGRALEILGHRNPRSKETVLNTERIKHWLSQGAQATATVWNIFVDQKIVEGKKQTVTRLTKKRRETIAKAEKSK
ncbi:MAG TPA: 30S ribosomal protein S16 [Patescibacteria group bacterium]|nr:30S ribosomal protein S16 [Patescibacteria group bacterium]